MAIAPTGDIFKSLEFDGESSKSYGVYITGEAVYNAPEKDVEMISIPGRNGSFALDKGRFENIEVTYPAGIFASNEGDFATAVSDFRNYLCSKKGYCRLTDDYNPDEFRMAIYKSGLEVTPAQLKAGEFEITFDCKPQRYLMSGESPIDITTGDTVLNPTLFEASPTIEVEGYGSIALGNFSIDIQDVDLGNITLVSEKKSTGTSMSRAFPGVLVESGNPEYVDKVEATAVFHSSKILKAAEITSSSGYTNITTDVSVDGLDGYLQLTMNELSYATATASKNCSVTVTFTADDDTTATVTFSLYAVYTRGAAPNFDSYQVSVTQSNSSGFVNVALNSDIVLSYSDVIAVSTASALGTPTYIDCDLGEAYRKINGRTYSLNPYIDLGSQLPKLAVGNTTITYDNTITQLTVIPRWWKV